MKHLTAHLERTYGIHTESKVKKQFHSIFINVLTAKIICVHCHKEIYDLDQYILLNSDRKWAKMQQLSQIHIL